MRLYVLRYQRLKKLRYVMLLGGRCRKCGYHKNLAALDFHHPDGNGREDYENWRSPKFKVEECALMCCRCHREEENPELDNYEEVYVKDDNVDQKRSVAIKLGLANKVQVTISS